MRRKVFWLTAAVLILLSALGAHTLYRNRRAARNRTAIEAALHRFSEMAPLGATRRHVKEILRTKGVSFSERCCFEPNGPSSILVQVGQEEKPWYCSEWPDYVAFEFSAIEAPHRAFDILESDVLKLIHLTSNGEGCL